MDEIEGNRKKQGGMEGGRERKGGKERRAEGGRKSEPTFPPIPQTTAVQCLHIAFVFALQSRFHTLVFTVFLFVIHF